MVGRLCRLGVHILSILLFDQFPWQAFSPGIRIVKARHELETRLPPGSLAASHRGFAFCVADPIGSAHEPARIDLHQLTQVLRDSCLKSLVFLKNSRELRPEFPGLGRRRQTLTEEKNQKPTEGNETYEHINPNIT